jgi:hypothetical protein
LLDAVGRAVVRVLPGDALAPAVAVFRGDAVWPVGDGVRVPGLAVDEACALGCGDGVKIDGTDEPPPVQAETVTARRTAPAAERPAISHAPRAATGVVRRIFMNPPRTRARYTNPGDNCKSRRDWRRKREWATGRSPGTLTCAFPGALVGPIGGHI